MRSETPKSISSIPEIHRKARSRSSARPSAQSPAARGKRRMRTRYYLTVASNHCASNCKLAKTRGALDKYAASKYKDRLSEDGFVGVRSGPRIKGKRAPRWKEAAKRRGKRDSPFSGTRNSCLQVIISCSRSSC